MGDLLANVIRKMTLHDCSKRSIQTAPVRPGCYICTDPEFALMGLPLCYTCMKCGEHIAADDDVCDDCGMAPAPPPEHDNYEVSPW